MSDLRGSIRVESDQPLPEFDRPPVEEVALCVYFAPLVAMKIAHLGLLWEEWRDELPIVDEQPEIPPVLLDAGDTDHGEALPAFQIRFSGGIPAHRVVLSRPGDVEIVQVQRDRIVHNWRKDTGATEYPHYEQLRPKFERDVVRFQSFVEGRGLGVFQPTQCEVTYVNPLPVDENTRQLDRVVAPWAGAASDGYLGRPEDVAINSRYRLVDVAGEHRGRLYLSVGPAFKPNGAPVLLLQSLARYAVASSDSSGIMTALDSAHEAAVRGFASFTTPIMHREWGRRDVGLADISEHDGQQPLS